MALLLRKALEYIPRRV